MLTNMSHQQNSSLKKEKYMDDLYCMSSTCMLLKMMEKSRNSVCPPKKIRAEGFAEKNLAQAMSRKKILQNENPPTLSFS